MTALKYKTDTRTSLRMRLIRSKNTAPEKTVRRVLTRLGYRYRLHDRRLPGHPDIVFRKEKKAIFIHGCFWHRHAGCKRCSSPRKNKKLWEDKFQLTVKRDRSNQRKLKLLGWSLLIMWECSLRDEDAVSKKLIHFMRKRSHA